MICDDEIVRRMMRAISGIIADMASKPMAFKYPTNVIMRNLNGGSEDLDIHFSCGILITKDRGVRDTFSQQLAAYEKNILNGAETFGQYKFYKIDPEGKILRGESGDSK